METLFTLIVFLVYFAIGGAVLAFINRQIGDPKNVAISIVIVVAWPLCFAVVGGFTLVDTYLNKEDKS